MNYSNTINRMSGAPLRLSIPKEELRRRARKAMREIVKKSSAKAVLKQARQSLGGQEKGNDDQ